MARRNLDMLPLLDVFMVVLFVFATIQEGELDSSVQELDELSARLVEAEAVAAAESARAAALAAELEIAAQRGQQASELETKVAAYQRACGPRAPGDPLCPAANPDARAHAELAEVQQRLLDNVAVFEVEIAGEPNLDTGKTHNHCCFRADPPQGEWRSCGDVPSPEQAREDWFDSGADGLRPALRETQDGYAIVMVRQDAAARNLITNDLTQLLRERLPGYQVYNNGISSEPLQCPAAP
ncbi:hypothetical protein ENSA5_20180 [Enhygromyxa salina]|uniref:Uncharacterized protein n=1 Tax=Enhygromyxa salina TaxID=215803 RepID=A0A2S9YCW1_9BACT|nr:hypothetical protein [Enhygromyxa salina]PRQ02841.1 hypothetical protein ENSA5_20180 [Enhygromyxa salina]